jgi:hypothetical protein
MRCSERGRSVLAGSDSGRRSTENKLRCRRLVWTRRPGTASSPPGRASSRPRVLEFLHGQAASEAIHNSHVHTEYTTVVPWHDRDRLPDSQVTGLHRRGHDKHLENAPRGNALLVSPPSRSRCSFSPLSLVDATLTQLAGEARSADDDMQWKSRSSTSR